MADLSGSYFSHRREKIKEQETLKKEQATQGVVDKPLETDNKPVSDDTARSEPVPEKEIVNQEDKPVNHEEKSEPKVVRKVYTPPAKRIAESSKGNIFGNTGIKYNTDKKRTSDIKGVNSNLLASLKHRLSKYGVSSNADAINVFLAGTLNEYSGLSPEVKQMAKSFREDDIMNANKLIESGLSRIEGNLREISASADFIYHMISILSMYTVNHEVYSKFIKNKTIDVTDPAVFEFVNKLTDDFMALSSAMNISNGRPIK